MKRAVFFVYHCHVALNLDPIHELLNDKGYKTKKREDTSAPFCTIFGLIHLLGHRLLRIFGWSQLLHLLRHGLLTIWGWIGWWKGWIGWWKEDIPIFLDRFMASVVKGLCLERSFSFSQGIQESLQPIKFVVHKLRSRKV